VRVLATIVGGADETGLEAEALVDSESDDVVAGDDAGGV
jgi:hypothetical protein